VSGDLGPGPPPPPDPALPPDSAVPPGPDATEGPDGAASGPVRRGAARRRRRRRVWRVVLVVVAVVVVAVVAVGGWYYVEAHPSGPAGTPVIVQVAAGEPFGNVLSDLATKKVIDSSLAFRLGDLFNGTPTVAPGGYLFHTNLSFHAVRNVFGGGPDVFPLVVPAGFTVQEVADRVGDLPGLQSADFEKAATSGVVRSPWQPPGRTSLEGLLGVGTYEVVPGETDVQLLQAMVERFDTVAASAGLTPASAARLGLTPYQVITVASVVQKEGYIVKNMGPVARVIVNRLANGMPLQMDSTVLYALGQDGGTVTPADEQIQSPYNTYQNKGLTPTPICFPSETALAAAVHPPPGNWLYFVVIDKDGTEAFSATYAQQQANEAIAASRGL
jgi:UPF0755 protein